MVKTANRIYSFIWWLDSTKKRSVAVEQHFQIHEKNPNYTRIIRLLGVMMT